MMLVKISLQCILNTITCFFPSYIESAVLPVMVFFILLVRKTGTLQIYERDFGNWGCRTPSHMCAETYVRPSGTAAMKLLMETLKGFNRQLLLETFFLIFFFFFFMYMRYNIIKTKYQYSYMLVCKLNAYIYAFKYKPHIHIHKYRRNKHEHAYIYIYIPYIYIYIYIYIYLCNIYIIFIIFIIYMHIYT